MRSDQPSVWGRVTHASHASHESFLDLTAVALPTADLAPPALICVTPPIKAGPADAKIPASFAGIDDLLRVLKHLKFALNVAFVVRHEYFLHPKSGNLQEVS